jgi:spermidine synthase
MGWDRIDTAQDAGTLLELYQKDGVFMIRANGLELMNGFNHESETMLGRLAGQMAPSGEPRILIGGLGLGYTTAALIAALGDRGAVTVVEFSAAVIDWFHRYVRRSVLPNPPANLNIVEADIVAYLREDRRHDVIVLDVDNGPEPLVRPENRTLYSEEGLQLLRRTLTPDGVVLLWSGFQSDEFAVRARNAGFFVECRPIANFGRDDLSHFLYALTPVSAGGASRKAAERP